MTRALPADLDALVAEGEREGWGFVRRLADAWAAGDDRFDRAGETLFAARVGGMTVGVCGLSVDPYAGSDRVGRLRHLYVLADFRRRGVGRRLVTEVIAAAGAFERVRLRTSNPAAARLYEAAGFVATAEADATHTLNLGPRGGGTDTRSVTPL